MCLCLSKLSTLLGDLVSWRCQQQRAHSLFRDLSMQLKEFGACSLHPAPRKLHPWCCCCCLAGCSDSVTAASDLCAHVNIAPQLRDAALKLVGADLYKKVKAPGDTSLYRYVSLSVVLLLSDPGADAKKLQLPHNSNWCRRHN